MRANRTRSIQYWSFAAVVLYASYLLILLSLPYIVFKPNIEFLKTKQLIYHIDIWRWSFYAHVFSSPIIILSGLFQLNRKVAHEKKKLHKLLGYSYTLTLLIISGPSGLIMSAYANGGYIAQVSFVSLSSLWILFTFLGITNIRKGKIETHLKWFIRSYALTLSAVTLRFYAYLFDVFNVPLHPKETYILLSYLSWIPNLLMAELIVRSSLVKYLLTPPTLQQ